MSLTKEQIESSGVKSDEAGGAINIPRTLDSALIVMSFREIDGGTKVSFRSKGLDVCELAKKFNGGGHVRASACVINENIEAAKAMLIAAAEEYIHRNL